MIAKVFDAEGVYQKTVSGSLEVVEMNLPPGGSFEEIAAYEPPPILFGPYAPGPDAPAE